MSPITDEPKSDEQWAAENDAQTLATADEILNDVGRLNAAKAAAKNLAIEKLDRVKSLLNAAGVPFGQMFGEFEIVDNSNVIE